ncbi:hypothetical protein FOZ60_015003 [Perkinsus olseni]|uniref:Uncharacterized protein n=1 Tax=Perkinsus olseni TaxID=32597 RepID=A0A7J6UF05_PEROL|nr:hypothetical protein FOZ60_015003 [Perkinsus olseni]KAF4755785.1 hypothetical protein FOZ62_015286 [Perkinsus olseni]
MFKFNHIELRMLEEMHEEREERRRMRESFSREELLEKFPREQWDDAYAPDESWEERWERRQKEKREAPKGLLGLPATACLPSPDLTAADLITRAWKCAWGISHHRSIDNPCFVVFEV